MSGHSKWATIKRKKEATDSKRSNMYAKLLRAVEVAAREGGGNVEGEHDARVRGREGEELLGSERQHRAGDQARRPASSATAQRYEEIVYEGYAPGGIALLIEALTDNRNRTAQEVRHAFTRNGGSLGETGTVAWQFTRKGVIVVEKAVAPDEEHLLELALDGGAEDLTDSESSWDIVTAPQDFKTVQTALEKAGVPIFSAELSMLPQSHDPGRRLRGDRRCCG